MDLKGSVALVTGSSSGIGAATAIAFARHGCAVAVTYASDKEGGAATVKSCRELSTEASLFKLDVRDDGNCRSVVDEIVKTWGRIDVVINSAGMTRRRDLTDLEALTGKDFLDLYEVNVVGAYQVTRAAASHLKARSVAHVVNIASMAAYNGRGSSIAYAASKGALITMTKSLARALGPVVRVNAVCPGLVRGSWTQETLGEDNYEAQLRLIANRLALKKIATADDIAASVVGVVTGGDMITGSAILVDGGSHLGTAPLF